MSPKYQVPQFIETETKLIGPFTLKQFLFVAGGVSTSAMAYILLNGVWFLLAVVVIMAFFGALAFLKINGVPFINYLAYMLSYSLSSKRYVYRPGMPEDKINVPPANG